jgi:hypothetical protein
MFLFILQVTKSNAQIKPLKQSLTKPLEKKAADSLLKSQTKQIDFAKEEVMLLGDTSLKKINTKTINTIDTLQVSKDSLDAPVKYQAKDSGVLIISTKEFILYGKSTVEQKSMTLDAGVIKYDGTKQTLFAYGATDSTNNPLNKTKMQDGQNTTYSDTVAFNLKSQKGRTVNTFYTEGELFVQAQVLKKIDKDAFYGWKGRFTTCNLDVPHFAFRTRKLKMITSKLAVSGPASPEFEGVPMPIGIPFGIYPLNRGRHSGVLAPQFTISEDYGIGIEGLGYYKVLNDNFDVTILSKIYSYGGWSLNVAPKYIVRYKYSGTMNIAFQNVKSLNRFFTKTNQEFTSTPSFNVTWNHTRDNRARPGTSFGANVSFGSTGYNKSVLNNPTINYNNHLFSNINYTKDFKGKANLSLNASHDQNAVDRSVNIQLPTMSLNVVTFYPFQKKEKIGKARWYESLGIGYGGSFTNRVGFYDSAINIKHIIDTMQWSATHNIPISISLPALGPITIAPSISYNEAWYDRSYGRVWNATTKKIDSSTTKGFLRKPNTSFGLSLSTRIFGTYLFKHSKNIQAIRHEIRPTIGFNYTPNLESKYNYTLQTDTNKNTVRISKITGQIAGSEASFGNISFGLDNLFEMKVKDKADTAAKAFKKVRLIDVLSISSSYNLAVDSFALQPFSIRLATNLFEKINISASTVLDPYDVDSRGYRKKTLMWQGDKFKLGRITGGNLAISTQFKSKPKDDKKAEQNNALPKDPFMTADEQQRQLEYARSNPAEFTDFNIPWSLNLSYSLNFSRLPKADYSGFETKTNSNINFNGDFNLTPKWKIGGSGFYNPAASKIEQLSFFISREMHCWQLSISATPINYTRSFSITISPKSGILRDLKINRMRQFSN